MSRTIIVGDVHGCAAELGRLLDELAPASTDRVLFVGDLIARGPDSRGVLRRVRELGAASVLGNHEQALLAARRARAHGTKRPRLTASQQSLLHRLDEADWALLESLPLWLELPEHGLCVVHAGVVPGRPLREQDAWTLTHIRSLDAEGRPSPRHDLEPWAPRYAGAEHIVFGHNSRLGLQLAPRATGIDTGCVYGGALTALVLAAGERVPAEPARRRERLRSVPAARAYYQNQPGSPGA